jgi:hypothetical protein
MVADVLSSEVPLGSDDLLLWGVDPEFVASVRISVESRHQFISSAVAVALVLIASSTGVVGADELNVVNEVPLQEVLEVLARLVFPKLVISGWISMESLLMAEALVVEDWSLLFQEDEVVARHFIVVPWWVDNRPSISIDPEVIVSAWVSVVRGEDVAAILMSVAGIFVFPGLGVVAADFVSALLVVPLHEVGWVVVVLVFPELVSSCWVSMVRLLVFDVSAEIHVCVYLIYLYNLEIPQLKICTFIQSMTHSLAY